VLIGIAAIVFPYRKKNIFEKSPDVVRRKVAGIPTIVYTGVLTLAIGLFMVWATFVPSLSGYQAFWPLLTTVIICIVAPVIIFYAYYAYRTRVGKVRMDIQFKEIPPD
jgi:hypothetical protein